MTIVGLSRSGSGQVQPSKAGSSRLGVMEMSSANGGHLLDLLRGGQALHPPIEVVRGASALTRDHGGAERVAWRAQRPEGRALVRLDQPLQHLAAAAVRRLLGADARDLEAQLGV